MKEDQVDMLIMLAENKTLREMGSELGITMESTYDRIATLIRQGLVKKVPKKNLRTRGRYQPNIPQVIKCTGEGETKSCWTVTF